MGFNDYWQMIKIHFKSSFEESRWKASGDYDKCFWSRVSELRSRPDANPDNPLFTGDLAFASGLPYFLSEKPEQIKSWLDAARTHYQTDPLTQLIAGSILGNLTSIGGHALLDIERLCLIGEALVNMHRDKKAIPVFQSALAKAELIDDKSYIKFCQQKLNTLEE